MNLFKMIKIIYKSRAILFSIFLFTVVIFSFSGCTVKDELAKEKTNNVDYSITPQMLCDYYDLPESTFDSVDFELFLYYLDGNWDLFNDVTSEYVLDELKIFNEIPDNKKTYDEITLIKDKVYAGELPVDYIYYPILYSDCDKSLDDVDINTLSAVLYYDYSDTDSKFYVLDFYRGLFFVSDDPHGTFWSDSAVGTTDYSMKNQVIDKLVELDAYNWSWTNATQNSSGSTHDTVTMDQYDTERILTLKFENGEVISVHINRLEGEYSINTKHCQDFMSYIETLIIG